MRGSGRLGSAMLAALASALVVGCDSTTSGTPSTPTKVADADLWDPCTQLGDDLIRSLGADPTKKEVGIAGLNPVGWKQCTWPADWYFVKVYSTSHTVDEIKARPDIVDIRDVTIGDRQGVQHRQQGVEDQCFIAFPIPQGMVEVVADKMAGDLSHPRADLCTDAAQPAATALEPNLPHK